MQARDKVLITGSAGMLGTDLCQELDADYDVYGVDLSNSSRFSVSKKENFRKADITDKKIVTDIIRMIGPHAVIHAAAYTDVDGCESDAEKAYRINCGGTENIALGCKEAGAVLIHVSTDFVFDGKAGRPYKESDGTGPLSVYGDSKLKAEEAVKGILERHFIIRTSWLYGRNGKNFVDTILSKARTEKVLKVVYDQAGSPTYTKDLAKAIHALLDKIFTNYKLPITGYGTYHVSNAGNVSWFGYAKEILALAKSPAKVIPISSEELARPARRPKMSVLDNGKFEEFVSFKMRRWQDALKEYLSS